jgi:hypothetical protein
VVVTPFYTSKFIDSFTLHSILKVVTVVLSRILKLNQTRMRFSKDFEFLL